MTQSDTLVYSVTQLVRADLPMLDDLYQLLVQERDAIETLDFTKVESLIEQKAPLINKLANVETQRAELASIGGASSWIDLIKKTERDNDDPIFGQYHHMRRSVARQNQTNQLFAASTQQRVATLYALLNGQSNSPLTYDNQGRTMPEPASSTRL